MKRNDLRNIDLNLLVVFEALIQERNVTRAAHRLALGQPAVSNALSRLRCLFNDPLFMRSGRMMEPTPRALWAAQILGPALDSVRHAVAQSRA
ncbi:LysR family transcriptional regulator [Pseudomonas moorei]|uniref:LysR family transcriptional regulator n=1 Tax=Pseudomonas moorei TaxID=395599 RepID=UPI00248631FA|nr:LysR family transcriptional regulator [Pseudomonas moorei]